MNKEMAGIALQYSCLTELWHRQGFIRTFNTYLAVGHELYRVPNQISLLRHIPTAQSCA